MPHSGGGGSHSSSHSSGGGNHSNGPSYRESSTQIFKAGSCRIYACRAVRKVYEVKGKPTIKKCAYCGRGYVVDENGIPCEQVCRGCGAPLI